MANRVNRLSSQYEAEALESRRMSNLAERFSRIHNAAAGLFIASPIGYFVLDRPGAGLLAAGVGLAGMFIAAEGEYRATIRKEEADKSAGHAFRRFFNEVPRNRA